MSNTPDQTEPLLPNCDEADEHKHCLLRLQEAFKQRPAPLPGTPESIAHALAEATQNCKNPTEEEVAAKLLSVIKQRGVGPAVVFTTAPPSPDQAWNPSRLAMTQQRLDDQAIAEVYLTGKLPEDEKTIPEQIEELTQDVKFQLLSLASRILRAINKEPALQP